MNPIFFQKTRNNFSVAGSCQINAKGGTKSNSEAVATVTVKTVKEKSNAPTITNK
jgi:hypothetical protein